jgi:arylsulfatase A-like enzyme
MQIVCIISDTFRYDHFGCLGRQKVDTPDLDDLFADSVAFDECYVGSFPTIPHRTDLFTGLFSYPYYGWTRLQDDRVTLAQILQANGYITQLIADTPHLCRHGYNFDRGFIGYQWIRGQEGDIYFTRTNYPVEHVQSHDKTRVHPLRLGGSLVDVAHWVNRDWKWEEDRFVVQTARAASRWLEENYKTENFYLHVDFFDVHEPWDPPEYLVRKYDPDYEGPPMYHPNYGHAGDYSKAELRNLDAHYKAEVSLVSKWVWYLVRKLKDLGIYDETVLIFHSDHGIYTGEHDRTGKSNINENDQRGPWPLYEEIAHVPLLIRAPEANTGQRREEIVQGVDVVPTVLDLAGITTDIPLHGHSLAPLLRGQSPSWPRSCAYSTSVLGTDPNADMPWTTMTSLEYTFLVGGKPGDKPELYHRPKDPRQAENVIAQKPDVAREMGSEFLNFLSSMETTPERIEALKARLAAI